MVLLLDLVRRVPVITLWYSNQGLIPNHTVIWQPPFLYAFSLFFMASLPNEAAFGFGLCAVAYFMLLVATGRDSLGEWILRYPERTGRVEDRIASFEVIAIDHDNPPPGERSPRNRRTRLLFKYPE